MLWAGTVAQAQLLDPSFHPPVFTQNPSFGSFRLSKIERQANGYYLVAGQFEAVDGHPTNGLARLRPDGRVDTTFTFRLPMSYRRMAFAAQPDGKVLLALGDTTRQARFMRLLPSGRVDSSFSPALRSRPRGHYIYQIVVQPDGKLLLAGNTTDSLGRHSVVRLLPNGRVDTGFTPPPIQDDPTQISILHEPTGRIVYAISSFSQLGPPAIVNRLLPSGQLDTAFACPPHQNYQFYHISRLSACPDGGYALGGWFFGKAVARLLPTGAWDPAYTPSIDVYSVSVGFTFLTTVAIAVQPDGRILACGNVNTLAAGGPVLRALPQGGVDSSFNPAFFYRPASSSSTGTTYNDAYAVDLLMEPSGHLLVAGQFTQAGGQPHSGLARLLPATPLAARPAARIPELHAWPVPARDELHVQLAPSPAGQEITLLDMTGRMVLRTTPSGSASSLSVASLPAGLYVLRVAYANGSTAARRIEVRR
ncbi:hypothetical protein GCM10023185_08970 [Hymenobacter saemangeumensis]|uniref:Secretion system C-terminal sorting domain-containing protein n=1 Tax=Hymenobacter saemangeumensis TaxID=1084522 RepID=A0ABP8I3V5_9BACT